LYVAVHRTDDIREYDMSRFSEGVDEELFMDLGPMEGTNATLTIKGAGHGVNGTVEGVSYAGITVSNGNTMNMENVGEYTMKDADGNDTDNINEAVDVEVSNSWNGMRTTAGGSVATYN
jgi:hypothetical protein